MTYADAVRYLMEQLPMFQRQGAAAYRHDLHNIERLCEVMGHPERALRCVHVAGTNGKGSVAHIVASALQEQGYRTGLFVSPHYRDFRERIKLNGRYISRQFVTRFVAEHRTKFAGLDASFFEISTVMAFQYFKEKKVDVAVIEVGMGGRLDSTNVIRPLLSVITNIGYDHTQFLGDTLAKIAAEKAGIIKPGVPVVVGETTAETKPVFVKKAQEMMAPIYFVRPAERNVAVQTDLKGIYQKKNMATAVRALKTLREVGCPVSDAAIKRGLQHVGTNTAFIGRWMVQENNPLVVMDSAHNAAGISEVLKELRRTKYRQLHWVYGTVSDKDIAKVLAMLPKRTKYYFCKAAIPRGKEAKELQQEAALYGLAGDAYPSVKAAYRAACKNASAQDMVLVSGSIFVVAEVV